MLKKGILTSRQPTPLRKAASRQRAERTRELESPLTHSDAIVREFHPAYPFNEPKQQPRQFKIVIEPNDDAAGIITLRDRKVNFDGANASRGRAFPV